MADYERLKKVIFWIISQGHATSQENVAEKLGHNSGYLSQIVSGRRPVSQKFVKNLCNVFIKVNPMYILSGDGEMILNDNVGESVEKNAVESECLECCEKQKRIESLERELKTQSSLVSAQQKLINEYEVQLGKNAKVS